MSRPLLSAAMYQIVLAAAAAPSGARVADLVTSRVERGERLESVRPSISRTLRRLERLGLVERLGRWDASRFKRCRRVRLTPEGRRCSQVSLDLALEVLTHRRKLTKAGVTG